MSETQAGSKTPADNRWIPLESNPEIFNAWAEKAGLITNQAMFQDVYGLDDELLSLVPQPVKAVILLFPLNTAIKSRRENENQSLTANDQPLLDKTILWIKQTIGNACGTIALLHAFANTDVTIKPGSTLAEFINECKDKTPLERAQLLETTSLFARIHSQLAVEGQTPAPTNLDTDLHFTCFVLAPSQEVREMAAIGVDVKEAEKEVQLSSRTMRLLELDGTRPGPIDRGECPPERGLLKAAAEVIESIYFKGNENETFNVMVLAPPPMDV